MKEIGQLDESDLDFISNPSKLAYVTKILKFLKFNDIKKSNPSKSSGTSKFQNQNINDLVQNCLKFNPEKRFNADELLKNEMFDKIRIPKIEALNHSKIDLTHLENIINDQDLVESQLNVLQNEINLI